MNAGLHAAAKPLAYACGSDGGVGSQIGGVACALLLLSLATNLAAQELQPRAYVPSPAGMNYFGIAYSNNAGGLMFDPSLPLEDAHVNANVVDLMFGQTLAVLGRTGQILVVVPYAIAHVSDRIFGLQPNLYRSGMADGMLRYAMNIHGAPAMDVQEYRKYHQKTIVGASITVTVPIGQYDPNKLINIGTNRWGFKPELGVSKALGKWTVESAAGVWFYTANNRFFESTVHTQNPLGSLQAHLVRSLPRRYWLSFDGTYYTGGRTQINGSDNANYQGNTRFGLTLLIPLSRRQTIKFNYFQGAVTRVGNDIRSIGVSYNVVWLDGSKRRAKKRDGAP